MGRIQAIPNLIQGISQQAPQQRRDSQCNGQLDCFNSPIGGAGARPPTELVRMFPGVDLAGAFFHELVRGGENYLVCIPKSGVPLVIDLIDGTPCSVSLEAPDYGYLAALDPSLTFRAQTVEDTTFILNRNNVPRMAESRSPTVAPEALVFVRASAFGSSYVVSLNGPGGAEDASYTTPQSDAAGAQTQSQTGVIAQNLAERLNAGGYSASRSGSSIRISRADGQDFNVTTSDGNGDDYMYAFKGTAQSFSRLPRRGFPDFRLKVRGERSNQADDYYVRFGGQPSTGSWEESLAPGVRQSIERSSMPHILVHTGYRQFAFRRPDWSTRVVGDEQSARDPGFIGKRIKDIFYHNARLGILHEGGCVWSKTRAPFTFFPDTVQTVLATAPVDITVSPSANTKGAALLDYAVQADESLFLWSPRAQFRVTSGSEPFKQDTVEATLATSFEYAGQCDPVALGAQLFTFTEAGPFATLRALQLQQGRVIGDIDVTAHVSRLIRAPTLGLAASDTLRCVFAWSQIEAETLYVYNYLFQGQEYVQSAWNTWRIPGGRILWAGVQGSVLSILQQRAEGSVLLRVNLTEGLADPILGATYRTRLDMLITEANTQMATDGVQTSFVLPYMPAGLELGHEDILVVVREDSPRFQRGHVFPTAYYANGQLGVDGVAIHEKLYIGQRIRAIREESPFYVRGEQGVVPVERLTVERFRLELADTGYTRLESVATNGKRTVAEFNGRHLGKRTGKAGSPTLSADSLDLQVGQLAEDVTIRMINDSFLPSHWQSASVEYTAVGASGLR